MRRCYSIFSTVFKFFRVKVRHSEYNGFFYYKEEYGEERRATEKTRKKECVKQRDKQCETGREEQVTTEKKIEQ